jgi:hypothetical protein
MLRIWVLDEKARDPIMRCLENHPKGQLLSDRQLGEFGIRFKDGQYGDIIFLMHPGIQIVPSFMGAEACRGMHGYHPEDPDSYASLSSNQLIPESVSRIQDIHRLMLDEMGLQ